MIEMNRKPYRELRCANCHALLAKEFIFVGRLSIKCRRCRQLTNINYKSAKALLKGDNTDLFKT